MCLLNKMINEDTIYLIFTDGKLENVEPDSIRIIGFKQTYKDLPNGSLFACSLKGGVALIPKRIIKKINTGKLWSDDKRDVRKFIISDSSNSFSPIKVPRSTFQKGIKRISEERSKLLHSICPDSKFCLAFGKERKKIKSFFRGFTNTTTFKKYVQSVKRILGVNGIHLITYDREGYKASTVLKSMNPIDPDNVLYEYMVGQYINKKCLRFPCFIETYDWLRYKKGSCKDIQNYVRSDEYPTWVPNISNMLENSKQALKNYTETFGKRLDCADDKQNKPDIDRKCNEIELLFSLSCFFSKDLAIMIEYVNGITLLQMLTSDFINNELINVLYQIYMPLSTIANEFTHYDLHLRNVMIYEPEKGKYIDYEYRLADGSVVKFKSRYIAKIIDYARSFFDDSTNTSVTGSSKSIQEIICNNIILCNGRKDKTFCGENYGYHFEEKDYCKSGTRNISHDLLLLHHIKLFLKYSHIPYQEPLEEKKFHIDNKLVTAFFKNLEYGNKELSDWQRYTASEIYDAKDGEINNVNDVHNALKDIIETEKENNDIFYSEMKSLGTLTIYQSGQEMEFTPFDEVLTM